MIIDQADVTASLVVGLQSTLQFRCRASFQDRPLASKAMSLMIPILSKQKSYASLKIRQITNLHSLLVRHDPNQLGGELLDLVLLLARVLLQHCVLLEQPQVPRRTSQCPLPCMKVYVPPVYKCVSSLSISSVKLIEKLHLSSSSSLGNLSTSLLCCNKAASDSAVKSISKP